MRSGYHPAIRLPRPGITDPARSAKQEQQKQQQAPFQRLGQKDPSTKSQRKPGNKKNGCHVLDATQNALRGIRLCHRGG